MGAFKEFLNNPFGGKDEDIFINHYPVIPMFSTGICLNKKCLWNGNLVRNCLWNFNDSLEITPSASVEASENTLGAPVPLE